MGATWGFLNPLSVARVPSSLSGCVAAFRMARALAFGYLLCGPFELSLKNSPFQPRLTMPKITFSDSELEIEVPIGASLLDACEENGAPIPFSCTVGACATCIIAIEEGAENASDADPDELETAESASDVDGARLACQITVNGDIKIRSLG